MGDNKKFYWLKLKRDFFKRHDIRIIEEMENGKDYILFYLKMLLESIDHEGELRFSETIPYNEKMLSVITNTNIDIVRSAMKVFIDLKMIEMLDDSTIYMTEVLKLTGSETATAERMRKSRQKQKLLSECNIVTNECNNETKCYTEIELEKEIEKDKEKELEGKKPIKPKQKQFTPPTLEEIQTYCKERNNKLDAKKFYDYYSAAEWCDKSGVKVKSWKQKVITWEGRNKKEEKADENLHKYGGTVL